MPTIIGALDNVPVPGDPLLSAWHQEISGYVIHPFASVTALKATWLSPPTGAFAHVADVDALCVAKGGTWRWWERDFGVTAGNTAYLTYLAAATPASSNSGLSIAGRTVTLRGSIVVASPATTGNTVLATMAAPYRTSTAMNLPAAGQGTNYTWAVRLILQTNGDLQFFWGGAGTALSAINHHTTWQLPDLVAA